METHYISAFTQNNGRKQIAVCGAWIRQDEHSAEPDCPTCAAWLVADEVEFEKTIAEQPELAAYFPDMSARNRREAIDSRDAAEPSACVAGNLSTAIGEIPSPTPDHLKAGTHGEDC